jgi:hypothetical protein
MAIWQGNWPSLQLRAPRAANARKLPLRVRSSIVEPVWGGMPGFNQKKPIMGGPDDDRSERYLD